MIDFIVSVLEQAILEALLKWETPAFNWFDRPDGRRRVSVYWCNPVTRQEHMITDIVYPPLNGTTSVLMHRLRREVLTGKVHISL